jgi:hypothetical protein
MNAYFYAAAAVLPRRNNSIPAKLETGLQSQYWHCGEKYISYVEGDYFRFSYYYGNRILSLCVY